MKKTDALLRLTELAIPAKDFSVCVDFLKKEVLEK